MQRFGEVGVRGSQLDGRFELLERLPPASLFEVDPSQIHERKLPRLVPRRLLGALEPGDRLFELPLLHEVDADVVIRIAEVGVDLDGAQALGRGLLEAALKRVRPAEERVRLRGRTGGDGTTIDLDGGFEIAGHLPAVGFAPELDRALARVVAHRAPLSRRRRPAHPWDRRARCRPCRSTAAACRRSSYTRKTSA